MELQECTKLHEDRRLQLKMQCTVGITKSRAYEDKCNITTKYNEFTRPKQTHEFTNQSRVFFYQVNNQRRGHHEINHRKHIHIEQVRINLNRSRIIKWPRWRIWQIQINIYERNSRKSNPIRTLIITGNRLSSSSINLVKQKETVHTEFTNNELDQATANEQ